MDSRYNKNKESENRYYYKNKTKTVNNSDSSEENENENIISNQEAIKEEKQLMELIKKLNKIEDRDLILLEITKHKNTYKNLPLCIFYSSSTMAIL